MKTKYLIEIFKPPNQLLDRYYWRLRTRRGGRGGGATGGILADSSEGYHRRGGCERAVLRCPLNFSDIEIVHLK